jgi:hypothetical protein
MNICDRGIQFLKLDGIELNWYEIDRYLQKNKFLPLSKLLKMFHYLSICMHHLQKALIWRKFFYSLKLAEHDLSLFQQI